AVTHSIRIDNTRVWTGFQLPDGSWQTSDAVLMRGGRSVALGDEARAMEADEVVDAGGRRKWRWDRAGPGAGALCRSLVGDLRRFCCTVCTCTERECSWPSPS
ncbi:MAG: hypothetical protein ACKOFP_07980, partial [Actinomycetota bacterium]